MNRSSRPDAYIASMASLVRLSRLLLVLIAVNTSNVWAQTTDKAPGLTLEEVIVTAERKTENLQDVPASVQAFDEKTLTEMAAVDFRDLVLRTPGVDLTSAQQSGSTITIRGVTQIGGSPTTGVYIDDVPISPGSGYTSTPGPVLNDTARVEVLKGPQGTLYGDSSMGGAVKFVSNRPDASGLSGHVNVEGATTEDAAGTYEVNGTLNAPLVANTLALRISGSWRHDGGYLDNVDPITREVNGHNVNTLKTGAARIALGYTPSDDFRITLALLHQRWSADDQPYNTVNIPGPGPAPPYLSTSYLLPFQKQTYQPEPVIDRMDLSTLTIEKRFGGVDLIAITGYFDRNNYEIDDATPYVVGALYGSPLYQAFSTVLTTSYGTNTDHAFTQEIRISSHDTAARFKWTLGAFYEDNTTQYVQPVVSAGMTANLAAEFGPGTTLQTFVPYALPNDTVFNGDTTMERRQYAGFGEASYDLTSQLTLTAGARVFKLRQSLDRFAEGFFNGGTTMDNPPDVDFSGVDPRVILDYKITSENLLYVSASKGFRPGIVNTSIPAERCQADLEAIGRTSAPIGADPDSLWNYEVGSKNSFFGDRLRVNAAAYQMNWSDIQLQIQLPTCGFNFTDNVGKARIRGGELEVDGTVAPGLTIGASAVHLSAVITEVIDSHEFSVGDQLPNTPKDWFTAYAEYDHTITENTRGFARVDFQSRGDTVRGPSSQSDMANYVYHGWDATNLSLGVDRGPFQALLYVKNVFDQSPVIDFFPAWGQWRSSTLRPRTIGLNLAMHF